MEKEKLEKMSDFVLFPPIEPYRTHFFQVSSIHQIYVEEVGNPSGQPLVFLHGGPGGGLHAHYRQYFDPSHYRIILFDQRGCGKSQPHAELKENSTWDLVADIEFIRKQLNIEKWIVFGGSWGSTLALAYAVMNPENISHLVLRGIFLGRKQELKWFYQEGASRIYPDSWEDYKKVIPQEERSDFMAAYYNRLTSADKQMRLMAARAWSIWEASASKLISDSASMSSHGEEDFALAFARIECHYFVNALFFNSDNFLLENINKIRHIPCFVVHGRYDIVCPVENAWDLKSVWPELKLYITPDAGHSLSEKGNTKRLLAIMREIQNSNNESKLG